MFTQQIFTQKNFHTNFFRPNKFFTESVRYSFVDLRWAQLYVSLVATVDWIEYDHTYQSTTTWQARISSSNLALVVNTPGNKEINCKCIFVWIHYDYGNKSLFQRWLEQNTQ